ncbi:MAG TPA: hypothetical protein VIY90_04515 [Steroidobacteraceae bacterium]
MNEHVGFAESERHRTSFGQQIHQPFRHAFDGFAQGGARAFQALAQLALVELGAGRDATIDRHGAQMSRHLVVKGAAHDLNARHVAALRKCILYSLYTPWGR